MFNECDQRANSPLPFFEYSEDDIVENSSNVKTEEPVAQIKEEPVENAQNTVQGQSELPPPVELKTEQSDTSSAIELETTDKIEIEEPADYKNLLETTKTETDSVNNPKKKRQKAPVTTTQDATKSQVLQCGHCDYTAKVMGNLRRHISGVHLKHQPYKCDICNFQCVQKIHLTRHKSSHYRKCRYCDYVGINQQALSAHRIANHSMYKCRYCDYMTKRKEHLETHENAIHLKKDKYSCSECSYTALYKCSIRTHKRLMHKQIYYNCDKCDYKSKVEKRLKNHINTIHTREELVYCAHCDYTSTVKSSLATHLRNNHALTAAFKCEKCDFASKEKKELVRHVKMEHENCYNFECNDCGFLTKTKINLEVHIIAKHLKQRPFQCKLCPYAAITKRSLFVHATAKHKEAFVKKESIKDEFVFWKKISF